jgi:hypothetical protein
LTASKLGEGRQAGLVGHHVLARSHGADGEVCAVAGDRGDADDIDRRIGQQCVAVDLRRIGIGLLEILANGRHRRLRAIADELCACGQQTLHMIEGVPVVDPDDGKSQHNK